MNAPLRRGACPGLSAPMPTGDGLLVRLRPVGTMTLAAFAGLCAAARAHGNGVIEITARGSIQVRGLGTASAARFAEKIAPLDIAAADGVAVLTSPLTGIAAAEIADVRSIAADLRRALARRSLARRLSAKISVIVDGGGPLNLDSLAADVRLGAELIDGRAALRVCVGGDGSSAAQLGSVAPGNCVKTAIRLLEFLAHRGRHVRARDIMATEGLGPFSAAIADLVLAGKSDMNGRDKPGHDVHLIGLHRLRDGSSAYGIGLAFGHADALGLESLIQVAEQAKARGVMAAPGRTLIAVGMSSDDALGFAAEAERLDFIVREDDPRRNVIACAGAPFCKSGRIAARAIAPVVAAACGLSLARSFVVHVSGCAKGCAHPAAARLTVVGTAEGCALVADGTTRDTPFAVVAPDRAPEAIARAVRGGRHV